ncbi:cell division protein FtsX [Paracoccus mangrovi]|uniref:Cell division protein FtsX n=1 Tax=Paracoccus mangrovi TaxID=1715645 RepID=A0ABV7R050_9RHOB
MKKPDLKSLDLAALWRGLTRPDTAGADRVVPPTGFTAQLTLFSAAAMAFLAVFALALALATGRLAERWSTELAQTVTVRVSAPADQIDAQTDAVMAALKTTPGIAEATLLPDSEVEKLLEPWFGPDVPVEALPVPRLIEVTEADEGFDADALRLRLQGEAPGAVLDDHTRWRQPLVSAANRLRMLGLFSLLLIAAAAAAMITLAAKAALAANGQVIRVLRLIGARDITIATAFVRRFTRRAAMGAAAGTGLGMLAVWALPSVDQAGGFLTGLGFQGWGWLLPLLIPVLAAVIGFAATRWAALRMLREVR